MENIGRSSSTDIPSIWIILDTPTLYYICQHNREIGLPWYPLIVEKSYCLAALQYMRRKSVHSSAVAPRASTATLNSGRSSSGMRQTSFCSSQPERTNIVTIIIIINKNLAIANRSCVSCINTNNNIMTLKSGLEVTQCH